MEMGGPVEAQSLRKLTYKSLKRSLDFFGAPGNKNNVFVSSDPESKKIRMSHKLQHARYESQVLPKICKLQHALYESQVLPKICTTTTLVPHVPPNLEPTRKYNNFSTTATAADMMSSLSNKSRHPLWKTYRVISNHLGSVRCVAFDPSNQWFCTGSADRTIKIWDLASGRLNHTLTGHIGQVRSLAVSDRHTYMFSAGDDKQVKCWDLEQNKVIRSFHGHLSGVYCLALHPTIDVIFTGGRDSVCHVWDVRTKVQIHALSGHENTVCSVFARSTDPQVVTGSHDTTIKLWDLRYGKSMATLTHHKKSVRALVQHPVENAFASAAADSIKKFNLPRGKFMHNMVSEHKKTIVNAVAVNRDGVMVSGGDDGSLLFSDWKTGKNYQKLETIAQPGSLDCEAAIYAASFDVTGSRLVTCEADKTIKMWKQEDI